MAKILHSSSRHANKRMGDAKIGQNNSWFSPLETFRLQPWCSGIGGVAQCFVHPEKTHPSDQSNDCMVIADNRDSSHIVTY